MPINQADDSNILFLFFDGIAPTIIDSQVLMHAKEMRQAGKNIIVWGFACLEESYRASVARRDELQDRYGIDLQIFRGTKPSIPFSSLINAWRLARELRRHEKRFRLVHARTDYAAVVASFVRFLYGFDIIWDCRGDTVAEFELSRPRKPGWTWLAVTYQLAILSWRAEHAARSCQRAIFVSENLFQLRHGPLPRSQSEIIPCVASDELFKLSPDARTTWRARLGYNEHDKVLVYSGSIVDHQSFPECLALFEQLHGQDDRFKMLILTPYLDAAREATERLTPGSYQIVKAAFEEVPCYLSAADVGIILRRRDAVNKVASPVKFAEYCLMGLPIIMNDGVPQIYDLAAEIGNRIEYSNDLKPVDVHILSQEARLDISAQAKILLSRRANIPKYLSIYR